MFCRKCGTPLEEGAKFCSVCGEKADNGAPAQQNLDQQPYGEQSLEQQPYGQQPYGEQPYVNTSYNEPKKSKKWLWISLSLVAVIAIAAVLVFVVFAGNGQPTLARESWPFKGDTTQTQFVNNSFKVFSNAFDGLGKEDSSFEKLATQPFDVNMDLDANYMGQSVALKLDAAYDQESLGMNLGVMGQSIKMMLLEDVLYVDSMGSVTGLKFSSNSDLSKPMLLEDRLKKLVEGLQMQQASLSEEDIIAVTELFVNSIDEKCFKTTDSKTTLTLNAQDIADTLRTFADKLDANKELKAKIEQYIKDSGAEAVDVIKEIKDAADSLDKDSSDFEMVWEVGFKNEKPVSFEITLNANGQKVVITFGYEQKGDSTDITFNIDTGDSTVGNITGEFSYKKKGTGVEFEGSITAQGQTMTISGDTEQDGDKASGTITLNIPGLGEISLDYDSELNIGMPGKKVKDDDRFQIDTSNAVVTDMSSMPGLTGAY